MMVNKPLLPLHHQAFCGLRAVLPSSSFKLSFYQFSFYLTIYQLTSRYCNTINWIYVHLKLFWVLCTWISPFAMLFLCRLRFSIVKWRSCSSLSWTFTRNQTPATALLSQMNTNPQISTFKTDFQLCLQLIWFDQSQSKRWKQDGSSSLNVWCCSSKCSSRKWSYSHFTLLCPISARPDSSSNPISQQNIAFPAHLFAHVYGEDSAGRGKQPFSLSCRIWCSCWLWAHSEDTQRTQSKNTYISRSAIAMLLLCCS